MTSRHNARAVQESNSIPSPATLVYYLSGTQSGVMIIQAAVDKLPFDIIYMIFRILHELHPVQFATTISHVSPRWRTLALESAFLWTTIRITPKHTWDKYEAFALRSRDSHLQIIFESGSIHRPSIKHLKRALRILLPHACRWRSLTIHQASFKIIRIFFDILRNISLPELEQLEITGTSPRGRWKGPVVHTMPNLRHLTLSPVVFDYSSPIFNNLSSLRMTDTRYKSYRSDPYFVALANHLRLLMDRSLELKELQIDSGGWMSGSIISSSTSTTEQAVTSYPSLSRLYLPIKLVAPLFRLVNLPSLKRLARMEVPEQNFLSINTFPIIAQRSTSYNFTSLDIHTGDIMFIPDYTLLHIHLPAALVRLPLLEQLRFSVIDFGDAGWPAAIHQLCPNLIALEVNLCPGVGVEDMVELVRSRRSPESGVKPLERLLFHSHSYNHREHGGETWMAQLEELRLMVELQTVDEHCKGYHA